MSSAAFSLGREVSVPNLPGMSPNRKSWIHRETSGEGFRRTAAISRPASALDRSLSTTGAAQCFANQTGELPSRPHTAALTRRPPASPYLTSNNAAFDAFSAPPRPSTAPQGRLNSSTMNYSASSPQLMPVKLPRFVELDKQVLRFYAHFFVQRPFDLDGPLGESTVEPLLCRKFIVYFYLFDETIEIFEPRELNAGIPQGVFFKRGKVKRDDNGENVSPRDLIPGQRVCMLGQEFVVTDADTFTREYFKREMDILLPPPLTEPEALPSDCGAMFATGLGSLSLTPSPSAPQLTGSQSFSRPLSGSNTAYTLSQKEKKSMRRTMSHTTKSNFNACSTDYHTTKAELVKTQRFLQYDGQVLRFMCVEVNGPSPPFFPELEDELIRRGEDLQAISNGHGFIVSSRAKKYALSFYLSSLELDLLVLRERETKEERARKGAGFTTRNNERASADEPLTILKRGRLAKNWRANNSQRAHTSSALSLPQFYEADDLHCGEVIDVYGRYFLLCTCDSFTHEAYRERGVWQQEVVVVREDEPVVRQPLPQSGDGFLAIGSPEDTLATVYGMPKVRKDHEKIARNQGRLLRAKAQMVTPDPIDASREFFVTFFLEDDTLQVFEEVKRNSGIWGGGFLKRGKYMNESPHDSLTSRPVRATDIFLGNILTLNGSQFRVTEMDNLSLSFCESFPDEFPLANIHRIVGAIMTTVKDRRLDVRALFTARDTQKTLSVSTKTFVDVLDAEDLTSSLTDQEILTIMRRFSPLATNASQKETTNTVVSITDDRLARERVYYLELCDMISHLYYTHFMRGRPQTATRKSENVTFNAFLANARARSVQWRRVCRLDPSSSKDTISLSQLVVLFQKNGVTINESLAREIVTRYGAGGVARSSDSQAENELDDVVSSRASIKNQSSVRKAMQKANNMAAKIAELRKRNPLSSTNNPKRSKAWSVAPNAQLSLQENTPIDYNRLCDDIYVCDWV